MRWCVSAVSCAATTTTSLWARSSCKLRRSKQRIDVLDPFGGSARTDDTHAERLAEPRNFAADATQSDHAQRLARGLSPAKCPPVEAASGALAERAWQILQQRQHGCDGPLGDRPGAAGAAATRDRYGTVPQVAAGEIRDARRQLMYEPQARRSADDMARWRKRYAQHFRRSEQRIPTRPLHVAVRQRQEARRKIRLSGVRRPVGNQLRAEQLPGILQLELAIDRQDTRLLTLRNRRDQAGSSIALQS